MFPVRELEDSLNHAQDELEDKAANADDVYDQMNELQVRSILFKMSVIYEMILKLSTQAFAVLHRIDCVHILNWEHVAKWKMQRPPVLKDNIVLVPLAISEDRFDCTYSY